MRRILIFIIWVNGAFACPSGFVATDDHAYIIVDGACPSGYAATTDYIVQEKCPTGYTETDVFLPSPTEPYSDNRGDLNFICTQ